MDRAKANKDFHGNLTPKPPTHLRDASFSSSVTPEKPITCQPHHNHHHHGHTTTAISGRCRSTIDDSNSELSIFDAHKYFNELANNDTQKVTICSSSSSSNSNRVSPMENERVIIPETARYSSASSSVDGGGYGGIRNYRARSFHAATPTASSEASWNSQQGLLSHPQGAISVSVRNPPNSNSINSNNNNHRRTSLSKPNWLLRRKCPCSGKKSVQVEEKKKIPEPKINNMPSPSPPPPPPPPTAAATATVTNQHHVHDQFTVTPNDWVKAEQTPNIVAAKSQRFQVQPHPPIVTTVRVPFTDGFTFPVLSPNAGSTVKLRFQNGSAVVGEDPPRESLEVFQPPDDAAAAAVDPKPLSFPFPPAKPRDDGDDGASDASSDLFEIESFSTATQSTCLAAYRRRSRDSFDEGTATPECYEPSEASIEWSVTTAEGYGYEESVAASSAAAAFGGGAAEQWKRKGGNGLLVSCRCEKAVSVGPQPVKCGGLEGQRGSTSAWKHVGGANSNNSIGRVGGVNKPPLSTRSHRHNSPRMTTPFAFTT